MRASNVSMRARVCASGYRDAGAGWVAAGGVVVARVGGGAGRDSVGVGAGVAAGGGAGCCAATFFLAHPDPNKATAATARMIEDLMFFIPSPSFIDTTSGRKCQYGISITSTFVVPPGEFRRTAGR